MKNLRAFVDARDIFCLIGFTALASGLTLRFGFDIALITVGSIVLIKGLTKWV